MSLDLLRCTPIFKRARWGGRRLHTALHKAIGTEADYAESWEIVDHGADQSVITQGAWRETTLNELMQRFPEALLGTQADRGSSFPLLVKFLDAQDYLSIQVHPNDSQAPRYVAGERGKTEAWFILEAAPAGSLYLGFQPGVGRSDVEEALRRGSLAKLLCKFEVERGDVVLVPAGTVHAIGPGVLLLEVQQASDVTFRLDDWGRVGGDGTPRPLHIQQSLECLVMESRPQIIQASSRPVAATMDLLTCDYFSLRQHRITKVTELSGGGACRILSVIGGRGTIRGNAAVESVTVGETVLVPAAVATLEIRPDPELELVETVVR